MSNECRASTINNINFSDSDPIFVTEKGEQGLLEAFRRLGEKDQTEILEYMNIKMITNQGR